MCVDVCVWMCVWMCVDVCVGREDGSKYIPPRDYNSTVINS